MCRILKNYLSCQFNYNTCLIFYSTIFNHKINYFILSIQNIVIYEFKYYIFITSVMTGKKIFKISIFNTTLIIIYNIIFCT